MTKYSANYWSKFFECPCCKRKVKAGQMMCGLPMCSDCFRKKEKESEDTE